MANNQITHGDKCPCIICTGKWEDSQFTDAQKVTFLISILQENNKRAREFNEKNDG